MKKKGKKLIYLVSIIAIFIITFSIYLYFNVFRQPQAIYGRIKATDKEMKFQVNSFVCIWTGNKSYTFIIRDINTGKNIFSSVANESFIQASVLDFQAAEHRGSFDIKEDLQLIFSEQTIDSIYQNAESVFITGTLSSQNKDSAPYLLSISVPDSGKVHMNLKVNHKKVNRTYIKMATEKEESYFGLGTQFTHFRLNGYRVPVFISEQGIGRGKQPVTTLVNLVAKAGGNEFTSYASVPHFTSSRLYSFYLENYEYSVFDFRNENSVQISANSSEISANILNADSPQKLIEKYTEWCGKMRILPDWITRGAIVGMQGGTHKVSQTIQTLKNDSMPIAALWLQDWVGQRITSFGKQLWWNWQLDKAHYSGWQILHSEMLENNTEILTYINPFLTDASANVNHEKNLLNEASEKNLLVKDASGEIMMLLNTDFSAAILDLTNPETNTWIKQVIQENLIRNGSKGWMADFGEALPMESVLYDGIASTEHNRYPERWAQINRQAIDEADSTGSFVFFMRSAYSRSPKYSTLFWLGDQNTTWDEYDGLKSSITGLLSSGLSGFAYNHSDIGGYTAITRWPLNMKRSEELFLRWCELNAFTTIYRTHEGNKPDENFQFYTNITGHKHFVYFGKLYAALFDYRKKLIQEAATTGMPVVRHMFLHYPEDIETHKISYQQFMLGADIIVAPVTDEKQSHLKVYLPKGNWVHLWSGKVFTLTTGEYIEMDALIGQPGIFCKKDSEVSATLSNFIQKTKY